MVSPIDKTDSPISKYAEEDCAICYDSVTKRKFSILPCEHAYHSICINDWFTRKGSPECPTCRGIGGVVKVIDVPKQSSHMLGILAGAILGIALAIIAISRKVFENLAGPKASLALMIGFGLAGGIIGGGLSFLRNRFLVDNS